MTQNITNTDLIKLTDSLKKSPIFNLSLSSKELFHSNFIKENLPADEEAPTEEDTTEEVTTNDAVAAAEEEIK